MLRSCKDALSGCVWIGADRECASPIILKKFFVRGIKMARLTVTGLGYFEARINSCAVSDYRFIPVASDYEPRDLSRLEYPLSDEMTHRIYCYEFDITELVREGENLLEVQLGGGFYKQNERVAEGAVSYSDDLKTVFDLRISDAAGVLSVKSDGTETWRESEITYSNLFIGEVHDPAHKDGKCRPVSTFEAPRAELSYAIGTPDRVIRRITPTKLSERDGVALYDVGENVSGTVRIKTHAPRGSRITLRFAENIGNGELDLASTGAHYKCTGGTQQIMRDVFVADGTERFFEPKFAWHAFRYFSVDGEIDGAEVLVIHADTPVTAEFSSSSEGMNTLFKLFIRTQLNNMHGSFPSDCPHRERLGYTGDGQVCSEAAMLTLDSHDFYRKWIRDILDCQNKVNGHVQHTAPFQGGGGGPGGWDSAIVIVPDNCYRIFGEREVLEECYGPACRFIDYLLSRSEDGLVVREEEGGWCLGDWCTLGKTEIPREFVNTCYLIRDLRTLERWAHVLGRTSDIKKFAEVRTRAENSVIKHYRDDDGISYLGGVHGADAFAVWCGIAGEKTAARAAKKYDALGHFDTGFLGTDILLGVLLEYGHADVAAKLLESRECGSFLYMKDRGATTLWESWSGDNSHDHPMFGGGVRHLFTHVLGIRQPDGSAGFERVIFDPKLPEGPFEARGSIRTPRGVISVDVAVGTEGRRARITVPDGVSVEYACEEL